MKTTGKRVREEVSNIVDAELVAAGKAAKNRQRARATKKLMKVVGKVAAAAGVVAATVAVARSGNGKKGRRA
jgi:negative regulator of sigma E activity